MCVEKGRGGGGLEEEEEEVEEEEQQEQEEGGGSNCVSDVLTYARTHQLPVCSLRSGRSSASCM